MPRLIEHFIWRYQVHFRASVQLAAEHLFEQFEPSLDPQVFLVGVRVNDAPSSKAACIEPEKDHWIQSEEIYDILRAVPAIRESYPESRLRHSHPIAQQNHDEGLFRRALRDAVISKLRCSSNKPDDVDFFASFPVERPPFLVMIVLSLRASLLATIPQLAQNQIEVHELRSDRVPSSLVEAAINEFLRECAAVISQPDAGAGLMVGRSPDEILRAAAVAFFSGLLQRADQDNIYAGVPEADFDAIARVAARTYEGAFILGRILFAQKDYDVTNHVLRFKELIPVTDDGAVRKLIELTGTDIGLHCDAKCAYGLIRIADNTEERSFTLEFAGRGRWTVVVGQKPMMVVQDRIPSLPKPTIDSERLRADLRRVFPEITEEGAGTIVDGISGFVNEPHGALVIVTEDAASEAARLGREGMAIQPIKVSPKLMASLTSIDGAVICSTVGECVAIGVILDGMATAGGKRSRGARYNSAVRYVSTRKSATMAIVVSEDGGVDLIPALKPVLKKAEIQNHLDEMKNYVASGNLNPKRESNLVDWFQAHQFYLTEEQCREANQLIAQAASAYAQANPDAVVVIEAPLRPDPDFVASRDLE